MRMLELADEVAELNIGEAGYQALNERVALALGWRTKRVTGLGMNGRTPGRWLWFPPDEVWGTKGRANPPQLLNSKREQTIAALRARHALALSKGSENGIA
jgi:hypothetical protein